MVISRPSIRVSNVCMSFLTGLQVPSSFFPVWSLPCMLPASPFDRSKSSKCVGISSISDARKGVGDCECMTLKHVVGADMAI
jgi:hypothetical protein